MAGTTGSSIRIGITLLALALVLGGALRLYNLESVPTELIVDEIDLYNSVSSIVTTRRDIDGGLEPFLYSKFTRNPPVYGVASYASSLLFGKSAFGLRLPAVLFGLATILFVFLLLYEVTERWDVAGAGALISAMQPICVQFSRIAWEPAAELPFLLAGFYLLIRAVKCESQRRSYGFFVASAGVLGVAAYTYMTACFYTIILAGGLLVLLATHLYRSRRLFAAGCACLLYLVLATPALWMLFLDPLTAGKVARIGTFAHGLNLPAIGLFLSNYIAHFRIDYLAINGHPHDGSTWRYLNGFGAFYWWVLPLGLLGLAALKEYVALRAFRLWMYVWLIAYPLAGALTNDGVPNAPRTLVGAPLFCMLAAIGLGYCFDRLRPRGTHAVRAAIAVCAIAAIVSVGRFSTFYFTQYVHRNSNAWDSGTRVMFATVERYRAHYRRVCFSVWPAWYGIDSYLRFYMPGDRNVFTDITSPACYLSGTLLVTDNDNRIRRRHFQYIASVNDINGAGFAVLSGSSPSNENTARHWVNIAHGDNSVKSGHY